MLKSERLKMSKKRKKKKKIDLNEIALNTRKTWSRKPQTQVVPNKKRKTRAQSKANLRKRLRREGI